MSLNQIKRLWRTLRSLPKTRHAAGGQISLTADESSVVAMHIDHVHFHTIPINPKTHRVAVIRADGSGRELRADGYWHEIGPTNENWMGIESLTAKDES